MLDGKMEKLYQNAFRCKDMYFQIEEAYGAYLNKEYDKCLEYLNYALTSIDPIHKQLTDAKSGIEQGLDNT